MTQFKTTLSEQNKPDRINRLVKLIYGSGDLGRASYNTLRNFFYAIFLTDAVGLDPRLASVAALISIIWDAINDPIVGTLSDNVQTRWGRRRPFMLLFSVPFLLAFVILWWVPPWESQIMLAIHITLAYMVSDTIQTLVTVPYLALTPELATDYDERTSLTSIRMFFNLISSLITAVAAPIIMDTTIKAGLSLQQGYLTIALLFGGIAVIPFLLIFFTVRERENDTISSQPLTMNQVFRLLLNNTPFKYATGIYVLNWISVDVVALMLPYFILYWVAGGDLLAKVDLFGEKLAIESFVLGIMLLTATLTIPIWNRMAKRFSKRTAYICGMCFWVVIQFLILAIQPGQICFIALLTFLAGFSVSNAHVLPEAMFPDVIDWDELKNHQRREGMYYGAINFLRKLSSAIATFLTLQVLGWVGYRVPLEGATHFTQSASTISAIRILTGPIIVIFLLTAICLAWFYPLTRERQNRIQRSLMRRNNRENKNR